MQSTIEPFPGCRARTLRYATGVHGDRTVTTATGQGGYRHTTYQQVGREAYRPVATLRSLDITGDQRVGTFMWNNAEHLVAYMAIPSMGA
ncbi:AMP-binding protein, partial [Mycolicibacterium sphagni]|uniref:AMP-binding protein n=1 Tax=Mycolicibacterium sphagni TaxID=1786 RepID=UPI0021F2A261